MKRSMAQQIADASSMHALKIGIRASVRSMRNKADHLHVDEFNQQVVDGTIVTAVYFTDGSKLIYVDDELDDATDPED